MQHWVNYLSIGMIEIALFWLILSSSRKSIIYAFSTILILVFSINLQFWTFGFAVTKLITGIMAMLLLLITPAEETLPAGGVGIGRIFRALSLGMGILLIFSTLASTTQFLSLTIDQTLPSLTILWCGFLLIAFSKDPFRIILGLFTLLTGFEIIYGSVERSLLINALLTAVYLLIAVIGSYLMMPASSEDES